MAGEAPAPQVKANHRPAAPPATGTLAAVGAASRRRRVFFILQKIAVGDRSYNDESWP